MAVFSTLSMIGSGMTAQQTRLDVISENVTNISTAAFYRCTSLTKIKIPYSVTNIDEFAFCGCSSLENIIIRSNTVSLGSRAFAGCVSLKNVDIKGKISYIANGIFAGRDCSSLTITCPKNSYIEKWSKQNGYTVKIMTSRLSDLLSDNATYKRIR